MGKTYRGNNEYARKWANKRNINKKQKNSIKKNRGNEFADKQINTANWEQDNY